MNPWETYYTSDKPLFHTGRVPVYVTTLATALQVVALVIFAVLGFGSPVIAQLVYSAEAVEAGKLWTLVTYAIVGRLDFWTALSLVFFYLFGIRVEMRLGTSRFLYLLGILVLGPTVFLTLTGLIFGDLFGSSASSGIFGSVGGYWSSTNVRLSVLIAFVWLHSDALFWPGVRAKWIGVFFVALQTLMFMGDRQWLFFWMCWFSLLLAYITLRRMGMVMKFPAVEQPMLRMLPKGKPKGYRSSKRKLKVVKGPKQKKKKRHRYESKLAPKLEPPASEGAVASVDHLLEKISKEGISSLSEAERKQLESASDQLSDGSEDKPHS